MDHNFVSLSIDNEHLDLDIGISGSTPPIRLEIGNSHQDIPVASSHRRMWIILTIGVMAVAIAAWFGFKDMLDLPPIMEMSFNILSATLLGSIVSFGGWSMFSVSSRLEKAETSLHDAAHLVDRIRRVCPFRSIFVPHRDDGMEPGNPQFCMKCPLAIDISSSVANGLIHRCAVYADEHQRWLTKQSEF